MSASLRVRIGLVTAGLSCLLLSYAGAQQAQTGPLDSAANPRGSDATAAGQTDRPTSQQADRSTARSSEELGTSAQRTTADYRGAQALAGGQHPGVDHFLANCLLRQNEAEVQLSEIALQKSENAEVKQFAQKMIQDHRKIIEQLQPLAAVQGGTNRASALLGGQSESAGRSETTVGRTSDTTALPGSSAASQTIAPSGTSGNIPPVATTPGTPGLATNATVNATTVAGNSPMHQLMQIERQINERCLQMARDEMEKKSGAEFDKCFVGYAIGSHAHALAAVEVISKQAQGTLAQVAQQAQPTVQQHLDHAKQLMKQLDSQSSAAGTQAQRDTTRTE
jgi:predicted outer membrane protein